MAEKVTKVEMSNYGRKSDENLNVKLWHKKVTKVEMSNYGKKGTKVEMSNYGTKSDES